MVGAKYTACLHSWSCLQKIIECVGFTAQAYCSVVSLNLGPSTECFLLQPYGIREEDLGATALYSSAHERGDATRDPTV